MSWQMPGGLTIKDLSLVIISAIGYEDEETLSFIFNATRYYKVKWYDCDTFFFLV